MEEEKTKKIGKICGVLTMFFLVTIILNISLKLTNRLPQGWTYLHIFLSLLAITLTGTLIKMLLK